MNIPLIPRPLSPKQRANFATKFTQGDPEGCWIWQAGKDGNGYPRFSVGSEKEPELYGPRKVEYAHRLAWALCHDGKLPAKPYGVSHKCQRRDCVNPAHLQVSKLGRVAVGSAT